MLKIALVFVYVGPFAFLWTLSKMFMNNLKPFQRKYWA